MSTYGAVIDTRVYERMEGRRSDTRERDRSRLVAAVAGIGGHQQPVDSVTQDWKECTGSASTTPLSPPL